MRRANFECSGCGKEQTLGDRGVRIRRPCTNCQEAQDWQRVGEVAY